MKPLSKGRQRDRERGIAKGKPKRSSPPKVLNKWPYYIKALAS